MKRILISIIVLSLLFQICCPFAAAAGTKFCKFCGEKIDADSVFCEFCGAKVGGKGESSSAQSAASSAIDYDELAKGVLKVYCSSEDSEDIVTGSGVIVFESDIIVTNFHVISDFYPVIFVEADNGETVEIDSIIAFDEEKDLALMKLSAPTSITPFSFGDSENLKRGDEVIAIGSPLGLLNTVSTGIVSGFSENGEYRDIQITAPISHGSSGGALLNNNGELIGITYSLMADGQNLNFAIPAYEVEELYEDYMNSPVDLREKFCNAINLLREGFYTEAYDAISEIEEDIPAYRLQADNYEEDDSIEIGDVVDFGSYEQDGDLTNGPEPIEWIVIDEEDGKFFLLSLYGIEWMPFNSYFCSTNWEKCSLRNWLNTQFYTNAFTEEERSFILQTEIKGDEHHSYPNNDTIENIFLLSEEEITELVYPLDCMQCALTPINSAFGNSFMTTNENCSWWIRTRDTDMGSGQAYAVIGFDTGLAHKMATVDERAAVRPAMWVG